MTYIKYRLLLDDIDQNNAYSISVKYQLSIGKITTVTRSYDRPVSSQLRKYPKVCTTFNLVCNASDIYLLGWLTP